MSRTTARWTLALLLLGACGPGSEAPGEPSEMAWQTRAGAIPDTPPQEHADDAPPAPEVALPPQDILGQWRAAWSHPTDPSLSITLGWHFTTEGFVRLVEDHPVQRGRWEWVRRQPDRWTVLLMPEDGTAPEELWWVPRPGPAAVPEAADHLRYVWTPLPEAEPADDPAAAADADEPPALVDAPQPPAHQPLSTSPGAEAPPPWRPPDTQLPTLLEAQAERAVQQTPPPTPSGSVQLDFVYPTGSSSP